MLVDRAEREPGFCHDDLAKPSSQVSRERGAWDGAVSNPPSDRRGSRTLAETDEAQQSIATDRKEPVSDLRGTELGLHPVL